jgi:hypothetical protein
LRSLGFCSIVSAAKLLLAEAVAAATRAAVARAIRGRLVVALVMFPPKIRFTGPDVQPTSFAEADSVVG